MYRQSLIFHFVSTFKGNLKRHCQLLHSYKKILVLIPSWCFHSFQILYSNMKHQEFLYLFTFKFQDLPGPCNIQYRYNCWFWYSVAGPKLFIFGSGSKPQIMLTPPAPTPAPQHCFNNFPTAESLNLLMFLIFVLQGVYNCGFLWLLDVNNCGLHDPPTSESL